MGKTCALQHTVLYCAITDDLIEDEDVAGLIQDVSDGVHLQTECFYVFRSNKRLWIVVPGHYTPADGDIFVDSIPALHDA